MDVSIRFRTQYIKNALAGQILVKSSEPLRVIDFLHKDWVLFRRGAGSGASATQADYQAFVRFLDDQGQQQSYGYSTDEWRDMLKRCYY